MANLRRASGRQALEGIAIRASQARAGNISEGGRCNFILDLYQLPCPEGTYEV